eukprot:1705697-Rhodomonas_salina.1
MALLELVRLQVSPGPRAEWSAVVAVPLWAPAVLYCLALGCAVQGYGDRLLGTALGYGCILLSDELGYGCTVRV